MATTFQDLVNHSIQVYEGMLVKWPWFDREERLHLEPKGEKKTYDANNGTVAFTFNDTMLVTRFVPGCFEALENFGYSQCDCYVPFSNGDYPKQNCQRWREIRAWGEKMWKEDFHRRCNEYCDKHGILPLDSGILFESFVMPTEGVRVTGGLGDEVIHYPIIRSLYCFEISVIGTFNVNNGVVVFVDGFGNTRVAKAKERVIEALKAAGYREDGNMFVPFSNGERICDVCSEFHRRSVMGGW